MIGDNFQQDADDGCEINYTSTDYQRMVVKQWALYKMTHINEDGVLQFAIVGVTSENEHADRFIEGLPAKYLRIAENKNKPTDPNNPAN